jgi:DNA polymerase III subunit delta
VGGVFWWREGATISTAHWGAGGQRGREVERRHYTGLVSELKPAYLVCGDDTAKLDAWRARVRSRAAAEAPEATLEVFRDDRLTVEAVAESLASLTLSVGRRYLLVDGVERWKDREVEPVGPALAAAPPGTVAVFIAEGKPPARLEKAVKSCGGQVDVSEAPKPAAYPNWVAKRAEEMGLGLTRDAARELIERVPRDERHRPNQRRLMRELEKLAIFAEGEREMDADAVALLTSSETDARVYELGDAVIEGDAQRALQIAEDLRSRGEDMMHILFALLRQLRDCYRCAAMIAAGRSQTEVQATLRVPPFVARRVVARAKAADPERLERALDLLAELDYAIRGAGTRDQESALTLTLVGATSADDGA